MTDFLCGSMTRRAFGQLSTAALAAAAAAAAAAAKAAPPAALNIGVLLYPEVDQIDVTGPFEVLSRIPGASIHLIGREAAPVRDTKGLVLTPTLRLADAPPLDVLHVPGGPGQEALMDDEAVLTLISRQMETGRMVFSVCTGALLCGAAGILKGRRATTHWASFDLLPFFGALPVDERVVVDGNLVCAAGVTAGIDGALRVAALLRGDEAAQAIQLTIEYAPEPPFDAGSPETAPREVVRKVRADFDALSRARLRTARRISARLGV